MQNRHLLDAGSLASAGHEVVDHSELADVHIASASVPAKCNPQTIIMLYVEPPLGPGYSTVYRMANQFRAFGSFIDVGAARGFPLTLDPIVYPYGLHALKDKRRQDTTLRRRRVFYAGTRFGYPKGGDGDYGRVALYAVRNRVVDELRALGVDVFAEGNGWEQSSRHDPNWDEVKAERIEQVGADFHLCMENSRLPAYISEKIHHGFQSDRVVLYLGCSRIDEYVPRGAFINLNDLFDPATKNIRLREVAERLQSMSQEEYDRILGVARKWRETDMLKERLDAERKRVTAEVLRFL
jgi:hypothetical protein